MLTDEERRVLVSWERRRKSSQALAEVADRAGVRGGGFLTGRLEGLSDEPRPGRPRVISDERVEAVITRTLEESPGQDTHWSTRSMAAATGMSQAAVSRIWRAFGLKPHAIDSWKLSTDPQFVDKVRDVVGLYLSPPENALVLCVDEKSQMQAIDRTAPILPLMPATPARMAHDYVRHGITSLFAAFDVNSGSVIANHYRQHRHQEFLRFLKPDLAHDHGAFWRAGR